MQDFEGIATRQLQLLLQEHDNLCLAKCKYRDEKVIVACSYQNLSSGEFSVVPLAIMITPNMYPFLVDEHGLPPSMPNPTYEERRGELMAMDEMTLRLVCTAAGFESDGGLTKEQLVEAVLVSEFEDPPEAVVKAAKKALRFCIICGDVMTQGAFWHQDCMTVYGSYIVELHLNDDHSTCHPNGCQEAAALITDG